MDCYSAASREVTAIQEWGAWSAAFPTDKDKHGHPIPPLQMYPREFIDLSRDADYICWEVAKGVPSEHDRLYYGEVPYPRVWMQRAYQRIEAFIAVSTHHHREQYRNG